MFSIQLLFIIIFIGISQQIHAEIITCDFDLVVENPEILLYLPDECQNIGSTSEEYGKLLEESIRFDQFNMAINERELLLGGSDNEEFGPAKDWDFRYNLYEQFDLYSCKNQTEYEYVGEFIDCVLPKRLDMINFINL